MPTAKFIQRRTGEVGTPPGCFMRAMCIASPTRWMNRQQRKMLNALWQLSGLEKRNYSQMRDIKFQARSQEPVANS